MHDVPQSPIDDEIDNVLAGQGQALLAAGFAYWQHKRMYPERGVQGLGLGVVKAILENMKSRLHDQEAPSVEPDSPPDMDVIDVEVIDIHVDRPNREVVESNVIDVRQVIELDSPNPEEPNRHDDPPGPGGPPEGPDQPGGPESPNEDRLPVEPRLFDLIDPSPRGFTSTSRAPGPQRAPFVPGPSHGQASVKEVPWRGR